MHEHRRTNLLRGAALKLFVAAFLLGWPFPADGSPCTVDAASLDTTTTHQLARDLTLHLRSARFVPARHDVSENFEAIDGCLVYGTEGSRPLYRLTQAYVMFRGDRLELDASCLYQNWPFDARQVAALPTGSDTYRLTGSFADGAATYETEWRVTPAGTARTRLVAGPELMHDTLSPREQNPLLFARIEEMGSLLQDLREETGEDGSPQSDVVVALEYLLKDIEEAAEAR